MSRSKRFLGGLSLGYAYQAVVVVTGLWLTPFLLKHLGQHDYGLWLVGLQTLSYLMLMDFGVVALLPRETAYATGRAISGASGLDLTSTIGRTARIVLYQTPLVALGVVVFWFAMPAAWYPFRGPIVVALIGFTVLFPLRIFQAVMHGLQETPFLGRIQFVSWSVSTALMIGLVLRGFGMYSLAIAWVAGQLVTPILSYGRLRTRYPGALPHRLPSLSRHELFGALTSGSWVSLSQIAQVLIAGTDFVVIGKVLGASAVVPYACTQKLISVLANQSFIIMEMASPGLSQMKTSESKQRIFQACSALSMAMLAVAGGLACVVLAVNHSFVSWWLGESQFGGELLTIVLVLSMILRQWNTTIVYSIFALGYQRRISITTILDGIVTLSMGATLVWMIGPMGAPLGSILGVCLVSFPGNLSAFARELEVSVFALVASLWSWIWRFAVMAVLAGVWGFRWHANLPYVAGTAAATSALYCALMLPMIMKSGLRAYLPPPVTQGWDTLCRRMNWGSAPPASQELEAVKNP